MLLRCPPLHFNLGMIQVSAALIRRRVYLQVPRMSQYRPNFAPTAEYSLQLIPGHEAIGVIVEMGKNVKGFSHGDRCVADVGITVSVLQRPILFSALITTSNSVKNASIVAVGSPSSARTLMPVG